VDRRTNVAELDLASRPLRAAAHQGRVGPGRPARRHGRGSLFKAVAWISEHDAAAAGAEPAGALGAPG